MGSNIRVSSRLKQSSGGAVRVIKAQDEERMQKIRRDLMKPKLPSAEEKVRQATLTEA